jgi:hypothetical protein
MSLCAPINAIASGGKSSLYVAADVGECVYVGIPIPIVDNFSSLGERRYLAWISINKMHAANKTILKVISLWSEETLLHSTARRRNNDNFQPKLKSYFTYQTPDSAGKFAETKQNKGLACDEIYGYSNLRSSANNGPHISWTLSTVKLENITCNLSHHLRKPQVRKSN